MWDDDAGNDGLWVSEVAERLLEAVFDAAAGGTDSKTVAAAPADSDGLRGSDW